MLAIVAALHLASSAYAIDEAKLMGVNLYDGSGECGTSLGDLSYAVAQANAFDDVFDGWQTSGYWDESDVASNSGVASRDFSDPSTDDTTPHEDYVESTGIDSADVGYHSGHGEETCNDVSSVYESHWWMGSDIDECTVETDEEDGDTTAGDIEFGDPGDSGDMEILLLDTCNSCQYCVWNNGGYGDVDGSEFLLWGGFHGNSYDESSEVNNLEDYASNSRTSGVGSNWLDYRYHSGFFHGHDPQCPTAIVWGSSDANRDDMFNNGGLDDWINTGSHTNTTWYYLCDCDPADGNPISC